MRVRKKIKIICSFSGRIFSLYVFSLARKYEINGWISFAMDFVDIEAEGNLLNIIDFICTIHDFCKQLSSHIEIRFHDIKLLNSDGFYLVEEDKPDFYKENLLNEDILISS